MVAVVVVVVTGSNEFFFFGGDFNLTFNWVEISSNINLSPTSEMINLKHLVPVFQKITNTTRPFVCVF